MLPFQVIPQFCCLLIHAKLGEGALNRGYTVLIVNIKSKRVVYYVGVKCVFAVQLLGGIGGESVVTDDTDLFLTHVGCLKHSHTKAYQSSTQLS